MTRRGADRGLSPVVGTALMIGIVLVFSAVAGYVFLGMSDTSDPAPQVAWEAEPSEEVTDWRLVHGGGDRVDGGNLELHGAADPDAAAGTNLSAEGEVSFYPTSSEVDVVWYGDDGESYRLTTIEVEQPLPEPDEGCEWVEDASDNGSDPITIDGIAVNCDVSTGEKITVENDGAVIGEVVSGNKDLEVNDGAIYGDVDVVKPANLQDGTITGSVNSANKEVKLGNTAVQGSIEAKEKVEVEGRSRVEGDALSRSGTVQVTRSVVEGSVIGDDVKLTDATIEGDVYTSTISQCKNTTIDGQDCSSYEPRDPDDW